MWFTKDLQNSIQRALLLIYMIFSLLQYIIKINLFFSLYLESLTVSDISIINKIFSLNFVSWSMMLAFVSLKESLILLKRTMFDHKCSAWIIFFFLICHFSQFKTHFKHNMSFSNIRTVSYISFQLVRCAQ